MTAVRLRKDKSADALKSIGEAAGELGLQAHVLRYWEGKFPKYIKPIKRADGRRMFRPEDMDALRAIQTLVHTRGMTLKGAKTLIAEQGVEAVLRGTARLMVASHAGHVPEASESPARSLQNQVRDAFVLNAGAVAATGSPDRLKDVLFEMSDLKRRLDEVRAQRAA